MTPEEKEAQELLGKSSDMHPEEQEAQALLDNSIEPTKSPEIGKLDSALAGAKQGATLGFADELAGGVDVAADSVHRLLNQLGFAGPSVTQVNEVLAQQGVKGNVGPQGPLEAYRQERDKARAADKAAQDANPWSYGAGAVAGGLVTAPLIPAPAALQGAGLATKALSGARQAIPMAAVGSLGLSNADLTQGDLDKAAAQTVEGTALGAGIGGALPVAGAAIQGTKALAGKVIPEPVKHAYQRGKEGIDTASEEFYQGTIKRLKDLVDKVSDPILKKSQAQQAEHAAVMQQTQQQIDDIAEQAAYANKLSAAKQTAANAQEAQQLNHQTVKVAEDLQNQVMGVKKELGKQFDNIEQAAEATGISPENRNIIGDLQEKLMTQSGLPESEVNSIMKKLQPHFGNKSIDSFKEVKRILNTYSQHANPFVRRAMGQASSNLRSNYANDLIQGGFPEIADQMAQTNKRWAAASQLEDDFLSNLKPNRVTGQMEASPDTISAIQQFGEKNPAQIAKSENLSNLLNVLDPKGAPGTIQEMGELASQTAANKAASPLELPRGTNPELERLQGILNKARAMTPAKVEGLPLNAGNEEALKGELTNILPKQGMRTGDDIAENKLQKVFDFLGKDKAEAVKQELAPLNKDIQLRNLSNRPEGQEIPSGLASLASKAVGGTANLANKAGRVIKSNQDFLQNGVRKLSEATPQTLKAVSQELSSKGPMGTHYAEQLSQAADKNSTSKNATIFGLMQQPVFRKLFHGDTEDEQK